jgi:hypothetical protein
VTGPSGKSEPATIADVANTVAGIAVVLMATTAGTSGLNDRGDGAVDSDRDFSDTPGACARLLPATCRPLVLPSSKRKGSCSLSFTCICTSRRGSPDLFKATGQTLHERSALLPTVSAPSRAKAAEPDASTDRPGTRTGTIFCERRILGGEAGLQSLIRNPSTKPIFGQLQHAACRGMDPDVYHPDEGRPTDLALARCFSCHARLACLGLALRAEDPQARCGWYGGLGPADRDALAASLGLGEPSAVPVTDTAARAARLRAVGWTIGSIADELRCSRRTVQRYLRKTVA